tara:strand:- start:203 stop:1186 length:984 start_codon:yes stop_codon:yes gene_type:complete
MSKIQVNEVVNHFDNGAPDFPRGVTVTGISTVNGNIDVNLTNVTVSGILTATSFSGDGTALTGIAGTANVSTNTLSVSGVSTLSSGVFLPEDQELKLGGSAADPDFKIYNDSTSSYINSTQAGAYLRITSAGGMVMQVGGNENMLFAAQNGKVGLYYDGSEKIETTSTGVNVTGGITFNGDTADANHLDDYEEGTFTPVLSFAGGTTGVTYSMQEGHYTKIGRQVIAQFRIQLTSEGSSTGTLRITLPFTALDTFSSTGIDGNIFVAYSSGFTQAQIGDNPVSGYVGGGTNYVIFNARRSTGDAVTLNQTDIDDDFSVSCTAFYYAT